jgi:hypothetical protein
MRRERAQTLSPIAVAIAAVLALGVQGVAQTPANRDATAIADYQKRVAAYVELHNKVADSLPPLKGTDDSVEIATREMALADAIRAARAKARRGDIFASEVARVLRRVLKADFRSRSRAERFVMMDEIPNFRPRVNQTYPSIWPLATFPASLLEVMPALPEVLEYRLLSESLILRDVKANIVVDFMLDVY